ncbi:MAG: sugar ABC transporter permease [Planctomycetota bacterium]|nr:MAG: sugar ABC transporter permease [Planctomycetota bacterium]
MRGAWGRLGAGALVALALVFVLGPLVWVLDLALRDGAQLGSAIDPTRWGWQTFEALFARRDASGWPLFVRQLCNSLLVAGCTAVVATSVSATAAYALSRFRFVGRDRGLRLLLAVQMFPGVVALVPIYLILDGLGLIDRLAGLVLVYASTAIPFSVWMLKGFYDQVPVEIEEAARLDGANRWQVFRHVVLPLVRPGLAVTALYAFLGGWNEFILAATLLDDEARYTVPVALQQWIGAYGARWDLFAAGAVIVSLPVIALFYVLQRHLTAGLTAGAVKG